MKGRKRVKCKCVAQFVEIIVKIILLIKNVFPLLGKRLLYSVFFDDRKTLNK